MPGPGCTSGSSSVIDRAMPVAKETLLELVKLSREMLARAEAGAWSDLIGLEARRAAMMARYLAVTREGGIDAGDVEHIHELRGLTDHLLDLGTLQRQRLMQTLSENSLQRHAAARYRQAGAG